MEPYQEEYISNIREIITLTPRRSPSDGSLEDYAHRLAEEAVRREMLTERNMELLRSRLFPTLDGLFQADGETLANLEEFAGALLHGREELDVGLFCLIRQALLSLARHRRDRDGIIRELYWLGIGRHSRCAKLVGLEPEEAEPYTFQMRLCFAEAAAHLKYFAEIENEETQGYIMRSLANTGMGHFKSVGERTRLLGHALQVFQDDYYRRLAPHLPWELYVQQAHQLMAGSIVHGDERAMSPQDVSAIMESAYIVLRGEALHPDNLSLQNRFRVYSLEYYCGLMNLEALIGRTEALLDAADPSDYSPGGMYAMISLPAFYCQYLEESPELLRRRSGYLAALYRRILDYVEAVPGQAEGERLFLYLRQLSLTFLETKGGISYADFQRKLLIRFTPEIFIHSRAVAEGAKALCGLILDEEPGFFDDVEALHDIQDIEEKRRALLDWVDDCGTFHDLGKVNFQELYTRTPRQWLEEEYELSRLHPAAGESLLADRLSTRRCAPIALGHHAWYDGTRGYPASYRRLEYECRHIVDVIALVDWLEEVSVPSPLRTGTTRSPEEAVAEAVRLEGKRFSPLLTARLRDRAVADAIFNGLEEGRRTAYLQIFEQS